MPIIPCVHGIWIIKFMAQGKGEMTRRMCCEVGQPMQRHEGQRYVSKGCMLKNELNINNW